MKVKEVNEYRKRILKCCFNPSLFDDRDIENYEIDYIGLSDIIVEIYNQAVKECGCEFE